MRILPPAFASALLVALTLGAPAAQAGGPVLLTVTGAVERANRGAVDPAQDKLFVFNDVSFDKAMEFDADALAALPQTTVRADFPAGGDLVEFTGPKLQDVLAAAGALGDKVLIQAMDGYAVEAPTADLLEKGAVVAIARDGRPLGIGDFGPTQIVFPRAERPELKGMPDDLWIWQIYHIQVE
jgi:hypothetical protein